VGRALRDVSDEANPGTPQQDTGSATSARGSGPPPERKSKPGVKDGTRGAPVRGNRRHRAPDQGHGGQLGRHRGGVVDVLDSMEAFEDTVDVMSGAAAADAIVEGAAELAGLDAGGLGRFQGQDRCGGPMGPNGLLRATRPPAPGGRVRATLAGASANLPASHCRGTHGARSVIVTSAAAF
jgi:hypothetical protein